MMTFLTAHKPPPLNNRVDRDLTSLKQRPGITPAVADLARQLAAYLSHFPAPQVLVRGRRVLLAWIVGPWMLRPYSGVEVEADIDGLIVVREWDRLEAIGKTWQSTDPGAIHRIKVALATLFQKYD